MNNAYDIEFIRKIYDLFLKSGKKAKSSNIELLQNSHQNMVEFKEKIKWYQEERRLKRMNEKL